jgi:hypothetical protein
MFLPLNNRVVLNLGSGGLRPLRSMFDMALPSMSYAPPSSFGHARKHERRKEGCPQHLVDQPKTDVG